MNSRVLFGSFVPVDSVLHRLDPRLKLVTCFWYVVIIFFAKGPLTYLLLVAMLGAMIGLSKVPLKMYWAGLKPLLWVIGLTIAIQVLFSSGGHVYWHWGLMAITSGGMEPGPRDSRPVYFDCLSLNGSNRDHATVTASRCH